eukprot:gene34548-39057_t
MAVAPYIRHARFFVNVDKVSCFFATCAWYARPHCIRLMALPQCRRPTGSGLGRQERGLMLDRQDSNLQADLSGGYAMPSRIRGLSGKLLWLTIAFVMLAEILIFAPSVATMRQRWLQDRLNTAAAASVVIDGLQPLELPRSVQDETLSTTGTKAIVLRKDGTSQLLA